MPSPSELLKQVIVDSIQSSSQSQITFAQYHDLALYHPQYGYYSSAATQIGRAGDFFTSATLSADFGELLGILFWRMWQILGQSPSFTLLEMGAGTGHLAADILRYINQVYPEFFTAIDYVIVETSQEMITKQKSLLIPYLSQVKWKNWNEIPDNSLIGCCFSNELVDAFPVHQVIREGEELREIYVTYQDHKLQEVSGQLSSPEIAAYFSLLDINLTTSAYPEGYRTEVNLVALNWLKTVESKLQQGYLLTIDYGYDARRYYHPQRYQGTLQCYYQHQRHHNPYIYIGEQDITTHVNFSALEVQGELLNLKSLGLTKQAILLLKLGLGDRLSNLSATSNNIAEILARRDFLHQLIDPTGLGNFGVLLQTKRLTVPQQQSSLAYFILENEVII